MSEKTADSRVLVPEDDEQQVIVKSAFGGSGEAYHTNTCVNVRKMREQKTVKISVAEWKGYHECKLCKKMNRKAP